MGMGGEIGKGRVRERKWRGGQGPGCGADGSDVFGRSWGVPLGKHTILNSHPALPHTAAMTPRRRQAHARAQPLRVAPAHLQHHGLLHRHAGWVGCGDCGRVGCEVRDGGGGLRVCGVRGGGCGGGAGPVLCMCMWLCVCKGVLVLLPGAPSCTPNPTMFPTRQSLTSLLLPNLHHLLPLLPRSTPAASHSRPPLTPKPPPHPNPHRPLPPAPPGVSFHSVQEVFTDSKPRMSISGWYHGDTPPEGACACVGVWVCGWGGEGGCGWGWEGEGVWVGGVGWWGGCVGGKGVLVVMR